MRCIELAKNGLGTTYPNPMVGSVIVHNDTIIGEGWHRKAGEPHAEVLAIQSVSDKSKLKEATLYVSLEPCSHYGKTPPCADLIIEHKIPQVIIGSTDVNPKVAGRGIKRLIEAGCDVTVGVLSESCDALNKRFITFHTKKRPYIILKWAQSVDHFIAPTKTVRSADKKPVWITNTFSRQRVHQLRAQEQAILVGTQTVLDDNPNLTTRDWDGSSPLRVVIDRSLKVPNSASVFDTTAPTLVITEQHKEATTTNTFETIDFSRSVPKQICESLHAKEIQSVIIEGGTRTLQSFIDENLWDEAQVFTGNCTFDEGVKAPVLSVAEASEEQIKNDRLQIFKNKNS